MKRWILMMLMLMAIGMNAACLYADDTDLFMVKVPPDVLVTLDLSGSMNWTPPGSTLYVGSNDGDDSNDNLVGCGIGGPFYSKSGPGHTYPCYNLEFTIVTMNAINYTGNSCIVNKWNNIISNITSS